MNYSDADIKRKFTDKCDSSGREGNHMALVYGPDRGYQLWPVKFVDKSISTVTGELRTIHRSDD